MSRIMVEGRNFRASNMKSQGSRRNQNISTRGAMIAATLLSSAGIMDYVLLLTHQDSYRASAIGAGEISHSWKLRENVRGEES